ncbi:hypothetical protein QQY66_20560 [Streptomyces sp. DG2A-72]|uniref:hypothetical protein n=1 Tax=Streptomyces sp. DG2A-72 TaxID=3051386 RepID=UPI00265C4EB6|nr:hypothetical protein [Streptomyces sp. DG2A-72]MDO0933958.1 hypothetical protein [Streptomyces sp. DG2A-72]
MEWTTLVATLVGAAIALMTALWVEARKDHRDVAAEWRNTRRDLYAAYLAELTQARNELVILSVDTSTVGTRRFQESRRVFMHCYRLRYQLELFAPKEVLEPALEYFRLVRTFRTKVGDGSCTTEESCQVYTNPAKNALVRAREAMRADMGVRPTAEGRRPARPLTPPDPPAP